MTSNAEIAEYFEGGAAALASGELIWAKTSFGWLDADGGKHACAYGACNYARDGVFSDRRDADRMAPYQTEIKPVLEKLCGRPYLPYFNDGYARNVEEVIDVLTGIAKEFRNRG